VRVLVGFVTITLALLYTPATARANGRFPKAQMIATVPGGDGSTLFLRATFGVIVSRDAGKTWSWLCEQALGFSSTWDPPIAVTRDGRLWVALADGARVTRDGCTVDRVPELEGELVGDLAVDGSGDRVLAVTSPPGTPAFVWRGETTGGKASFTKLGKGVEGFRFDTIEVAPSNPKRLYLTATPQGEGRWAHVFRSDDGGATIMELHPTLPNDGRLYVSAVDPRDPDRVYMRQLAETGSDVLLTTDGGKTWKSVLHMAGAMFGFARTHDGAALYAGGGDPKEGVWRSMDRGATWEPAAKTSVFCLNAEGPELLVGSNPFVPGGYAIARSTDRGATIAPMATFADVKGPVACDAASPCAVAWPETRALLATGRSPEPANEDDDEKAPGTASPTPPTPSPPARSSRCGCEAVGTPSSPGASMLTAVAVAIAFARARRGSRGAQKLR
jgi:hypothetical protein